MTPSLHETALKNPGRWPWLERALRASCQARSVKCEWLVDAFTDRGIRRSVEFNYCQIFRESTPQRICDRIELALHEGFRQLDLNSLPHPLATMGSAYQLLAREPRDEDEFSLLILRDIVNISENRKCPDYIAEVTLLARRGS